MRSLLLLVCGLVLSLSFGQQNKKLYSKALYFQDSIHIHWVPLNIDIYKASFDLPVKVELISWHSKSTPINSDFERNPTKKTYLLKSRKTIIAEDSTKLSPKSLILMDGILNAEDTLTSRMLYANSMLFSGIDRGLSKDFGLYISIPNTYNKIVGYRVFINSEIQDFGICPIKKELTGYLKFDSLKYEYQKKEVTLKWNQMGLAQEYSAYNIERSSDKKIYQQLNKLPYIHLISDDEKKDKPAMFVDKQVEKGEVYYYRLKAINHLGFVSGVSNVIKVVIPRPIGGYLQIDSIYFDKKIQITASLKAEKKELEYLREFQVYFKDSLKGLFRRMESVEGDGFSSHFEIKPRSVGERGFFKVGAISKTNDTLWSEPRYYFFRDSIPPEKVKGLDGEIDSIGVVHLHWEKPLDDLKGYRVFRTNVLSEEFVELTKVFALDTFYVDTISIKNLTRNIYYSVIAVDQNYNNSKLSDPVKITKPDIIPPVPSYIVHTEISENGIFINWIISSSEDFMTVSLEKNDSLGFSSIHITNKDTFYIDDEIENGLSYKYRLRTIDSSGNESFSKEIGVNFELGYRINKDKLSYELDREQKYIDLKWKQEKKVYSIQIYMAKNEDNFRLVKSLFENEKKHRFQQLLVNNNYRFKIQFTYPDGALSKLSKELVVEY